MVQTKINKCIFNKINNSLMVWQIMDKPHWVLSQDIAIKHHPTLPLRKWLCVSARDLKCKSHWWNHPLTEPSVTPVCLRQSSTTRDLIPGVRFDPKIWRGTRGVVPRHWCVGFWALIWTAQFKLKLLFKFKWKHSKTNLGHFSLLCPLQHPNKSLSGETKSTLQSHPETEMWVSVSFQLHFSAADIWP